MGRYRVWIAVLLSLFLPGIGHLYVRAWLRAVPWLTLDVAIALWIATTVPTPETVSLTAIVETSQAVPIEAQIANTALMMVAALDVYLVVKMGEADLEGGDATRCPSCGKSLEEFEDLEFCPWCTDRLESPKEE